MKKILALLLLISSAAASLYAQNQAQDILVISSGNLQPFRTAIESLKKSLADAHIPVRIKECNLLEGAEQILNEAKEFSPDLVVVVGSAAMKFAQQQFPDTPSVFTMVLYPEKRPQTVSTGVMMDIPLERQFQSIAQIIPAARKIGVLYNPAETGKIIEEARTICAQRNLVLIPIPVSSSSDVPAAINGIEKKVDVLWSVADGTVFSGKMPEFILEYTLQHNLPFMGISAPFVEAGALFSLGQDYADIGEQTAEICIRVLAGANPGEMPIIPPRKTYLYLNLRTASEIGLRISPDVIHTAAKVIR